jgi:hypothetical protein
MSTPLLLEYKSSPPMLCRLLSPFPCSIAAAQLHLVASVEMCGSTCDFFRSHQTSGGFLFVVSFFYHEVFSLLVFYESV